MVKCVEVVGPAAVAYASAPHFSHHARDLRDRSTVSTLKLWHVLKTFSECAIGSRCVTLPMKRVIISNPIIYINSQYILCVIPVRDRS